MDKLQDKVKLPKEVADAIERNRTGGIEYLMFVANSPDNIDPWNRLLYRFAKEKEGNLHHIIEAFHNGHEIEESPEDRLKKIYLGCREKEADDNSDLYSGICTGIKQTLEVLDIKIKGVNNHE